MTETNSMLVKALSAMSSGTRDYGIRKNNICNVVTKVVQNSETDGLMCKQPMYERCKRNYNANEQDPNTEVYNMKHKRRGVALIFNHIHFNDMPEREDAEMDTSLLKATLTYLGFEVRTFTDPTLALISNVLRNTAREDHTDADCLVVVAMSYGASGYLHTNRNVYPIGLLWSVFTDNRCPSLIGKPKLFFIETCSGQNMDDDMSLIYDSNNMDSIAIPGIEDIIIMHFNHAGSSRHPDSANSSFIRTLCHELKRNWRTRELTRMMTSVVRQIIYNCDKYTPSSRKHRRRNQIPVVISMLTRLVYFDKVPAEFTKKSIDQETTEVGTNVMVD